MCRQTKMRKPILYERELELPQFRSRPLGGTPWHDGRKDRPKGYWWGATGPQVFNPHQIIDRPRSAKDAQSGDPPLSGMASG